MELEELAEPPPREPEWPMDDGEPVDWVDAYEV
jgi:hypothetical protein